MSLALRIIVPVVILALAGGGASWLVATRPDARPQPPREKIWTVAAAPADRLTLTPTLAVFGEIVAGSSVTLRPWVAGRVVAIGDGLVDGAVVAKGDLLLAIDRFEYEATLTERQAELAEARARLAETEADVAAERDLVTNADQQVALRQRDHRRRLDLRRRGTGTQKAVDDAELALNEARQRQTQRRQTVARLVARADQQRARVQRADVAVSRAARDLQDTRLTAPFDGFLMETAAAVGRIMSTNDTAARIIDAHSLEARFQLTDSDYARLLGDTAAGAAAPDRNGLIGRPAEVRWRIGTETFRFPARIRRVGARIDAAMGGVFLYARLDAADRSIPLRPGAFVQVAIPDRTYRDVVRLPSRAVEGGRAVYRIDGDRLARVAVTVVRRLGADLLLRPDDPAALPPGAPVVTARFPEIGPGVKVQTLDR